MIIHTTTMIYLFLENNHIKLKEKTKGDKSHTQDDDYNEEEEKKECS
ncbi:hypothetical protein PFDG_05493 [Plasmodium falciparum Dd2]|uniref:Uncharacterized protein n=1 Tax=Plasmodium falciparum (isolate Dd2) TaxID=57267 RepID=A0A0L7M1C4_PLAF4|nr:hypothetical protein PFDG_05493 [Plasmodium falciparum Dd2]